MTWLLNPHHFDTSRDCNKTFKNSIHQSRNVAITMKNRFSIKDEMQPSRSCENCVHMMKERWEDNVVCVPHLKSIPAGNTLACELHLMKKE